MLRLQQRKNSIDKRKARKQLERTMNVGLYNSILLGVEFGYLACERGENLQMALLKARQTMDGTKHEGSTACRAKTR